MISATVLTTLLLASAALATPSLETRIKHRAARHSPTNTARNVSHWQVESRDNALRLGRAGAVYNNLPGFYNGVASTIVLPTPSGPGSSTFAWVGIDGDTCQSGASLQAGIDVVREGQNEVSYLAWFRWAPDPPQQFNDFPMKPNDNIRMSVAADSLTTGTVMFENRSNNNMVVSKKLSSSHSLCKQDAQWIVENHIGDNMANFSPISFYEAVVDTRDGTIGPNTATILNIKTGDKIVTTTTVDSGTISIQRS